MEASAFRLLYDNVHDFKTTALHVEAEIRRLGIRPDSDKPVPGAKGRRHGDMWISMKSVSHFNIGISLELLLKLLLTFNGIEYKRGHALVQLHDATPQKFQEQLQMVYKDAIQATSSGFELVAFIHSDTEDASALPTLENRDLGALRGFLAYLDEDLMVSKKRYSWELIGEKQWRHYISDLSPLAATIDRVMGEVARP